VHSQGHRHHDVNTKALAKNDDAKQSQAGTKVVIEEEKEEPSKAAIEKEEEEEEETRQTSIF
jgi:hypothetical protein